MSIRALTSPSAGVATVALVVALLVTGGATAPRPAPTASSAGKAGSPTTLAEVRGQNRVDIVPTSARKRRELRVLSNGCRYNRRGIPLCGALLGAAYGANTPPALWERSMGRHLGVHRTYFAPDEVLEAVQTARADLRHHRVPWISFKVPYSWGEMADGRGDAWASGLADQLSTLRGPVWVAFHHEPEGDGDIGDWTAMQKRLAPIVRATAPNAAYSIILTGWNQFYGADEYSLEELWPADTKIDLVGFDVYNKYGVESSDGPIGDRTRFKGHYFTKFKKFAEKHDVAWGLAETGNTDLSAQVEPRFVQHVYNGVRNHGGVAVAYFNTTLNSVAPWRLTGMKERWFANALRQTPTL